MLIKTLNIKNNLFKKPESYSWLTELVHFEKMRKL